MQRDLRDQLAQAQLPPLSATCPSTPGIRACHSRSALQEVVMDRLSAIGRLAVILAGLAGALLALCAGAASAAFAVVLAPLGGDPHGRPGLPSGHPGPATSPPLPVWEKHPPLPAHAHTLVTGSMPGWQIILLVAGAVLLAAALAATAYRIRSGRQRVSTSAAN